MSKFPCTKCGACCRAAGLSGLMPSREDGACLYLGEDNLCTIYDKRPEICRIGEDEDHWWQDNADACNRLQELFQIDKSYRVKLEEK